MKAGAVMAARLLTDLPLELQFRECPRTHARAALEILLSLERIKSYKLCLSCGRTGRFRGMPGVCWWTLYLPRLVRWSES